MIIYSQLKEAGNDTPAAVGYLAIGLFAGVRSEELMRLPWSDVEGDTIVLRAYVTKTSRTRYVPIAPNLREWLDISPRQFGTVGDSSRQFRTALARTRESALGSGKWPANAARHSFASYHLALHEDSGKTALALGHQSPAVLYRHYRALVTKQAGEEWFAVTPATTPPRKPQVQQNQ